MKVISGKLKGRIIKGYDIEGTRPTMDRVKESVFGSIQDYLDEAVVLDLFAGSGNLGIEAISNGASICYFVDNNQLCIQTIQDNLREFRIEHQSFVIKNDYNKALEYFKNNDIRFHIIFVDPPYQYSIMKELLDKVRKYQLLSYQGVIVLEYSEDCFNYDVDGYQLLKFKKYGDKYISIYKNIEK